MKKLKEKLQGFYRAMKRLVISVIENDFYGMASEMGFMMVIGIFPFMLFLTAVFGWMGNKSLMDPVLIFLSNIMPAQAMDLINTVLSEAMIFSHGGLMAIICVCIIILFSPKVVAVVLEGPYNVFQVVEKRNLVFNRHFSLV